MIRALTTIIALSVALFLAGCGDDDKNDISGHYSQSFESGIYAHEQAPCEPPYKTEGDSGFCYEPIEMTNELGLLEVKGGKMQIAVNLAFFNWQTCTLKGTAEKEGEAWVYRDDKFGNGCELTITKDGEQILLSTDETASCSGHCGSAGAIDGTRFDISSRKEGKLSPRELECIIPERAENAENC